MSDDAPWFYTPTICAVVLTVAVIAGVLRALGIITRIPLLRCRGYPARLGSPGMVQITAALALLAGFIGLVLASRSFVLGWYHAVPPYLFILTLGAYVLLFGAVVIAAIGLQWRNEADQEVYHTFRDASQAALLGALAAGLAQWVLCDIGEPEKLVSSYWREGCTMLGASSGLLLLGLVAAQWGNSAPKSPQSQDPARNAEGDVEQPGPYVSPDDDEDAAATVSIGRSPSQQPQNGDPDLIPKLHTASASRPPQTLRPSLAGSLREPLIPAQLHLPASKEHLNTSCFEARHNRTHSSSGFDSPLGANFPPSPAFVLAS